MSYTSPSRVCIDLNAYEHNLRVVRRCIPDNCRILAVLKADGYGHGAVPLARRAIKAGVYGFAVATVEEGLKLRAAGLACPIVVTVQPVPEAIEEAVVNGLELMVSDKDTVHVIQEKAQRVKEVANIHIKVDTGMGRQGIRYNSAPDIVERIAHLPAVRIAGIATHFAVADEPDNPFTANQLERFRIVLMEIERKGIACGLAHAANSAAIMHHGRTAAFDMVRPGIMTYGVAPDASCPNKDDLVPVLRWESRIVTTKYLPKGVPIGYGCTYITSNKMRVGIVPVGYADGYPVALSNRAEVLIRGRRCAVLGRVSMDQIVVNMTGLTRAGTGERVTLIGKDGNEEITATELASRAGTISYEILTGIGNRVERWYVGGD